MNERWSKASIALHWGSAAVIGGIAILGFVMTDLAVDSGLRLWLSRLHTTLGMMLMVATLVRLRMRSQSRPKPLRLAPLHRRGVALVHGMMYATLFALGASGVALSLASAWPRYLRGELSRVPPLEGFLAREVHELLVGTLLLLLALHVLGVVVHEVRTGGVLRRMLPTREVRES